MRNSGTFTDGWRRSNAEDNPWSRWTQKELVGDFKNGGQEWRPKGNPERVRVYDFVDKILGKANPYGVYDPVANPEVTKGGWVSVGVDHDTAEFAVETLRRWWEKMGRLRYPSATELMVTADGGGSNGSRVRLWKVALQRLADETELRITVCHFPPGTSKWNKIEHRMFSHISMNWRGNPLISHEVIVNLIGCGSFETTSCGPESRGLGRRQSCSVARHDTGSQAASSKTTGIAGPR